MLLWLEDLLRGTRKTMLFAIFVWHFVLVLSLKLLINEKTFVVCRNNYSRRQRIMNYFVPLPMEMY